MLECNMKTQVSVTKYDFKWTIENFKEVIDVEELFINCEINSESWGFELKPYRHSELSVNLYRYTSNSDLRIKSKTKITNSDGDVFHDELGHNYYKKSNDKNEYKCIACAFGESVSDMRYTPNDTVIITVNLEILITSTRNLNEFPQEQQLQAEIQKTFSADMLRILEDNSLTDTVLLVGGQKIGAHKAILSARSAVFAKTFQNEMAESRSNVIYIEDVSMAAMKEVIDFLYSRVKLDYDLSTALDVYYAADKYEVIQLRELCGKIILDKFNSVDDDLILRLLSNQDDANLRYKMFRFFKDNFESCVKSYFWNNFKNKQNNELFNNLISFITE